MIKMIGTNVLVTETETEKQTASGIILTENITSGNKPALVLAVGPEATHLNKGDRVFLKWAESMPVDIDGKAAAIIDMEYITAVLQ
jgi:co-chaperonin GroES (HSP10)